MISLPHKAMPDFLRIVCLIVGSTRNSQKSEEIYLQKSNHATLIYYKLNVSIWITYKRHLNLMRAHIAFPNAGQGVRRKSKVPVVVVVVVYFMV